MNTKLINNVSKPVSHFSTKEMQLTSRSSHDYVKNNKYNKNEIDTRFIPKFTPQKSYVSVEVLTKSRVAL